MDCSCRTAALRLFVQTLTRVQVPIRAAPRIAQYPSRTLPTPSSRLCNQRTAPVWLPSSRSLHTSCARNSTAEAAEPAEAAAAAEAAEAAEESVEREPELEAENSEPAAPKTKKKKRRPSLPERDFEAYKPTPKEPWMIQKEALQKKFPGGWKPRKRLSPDALVGIRMLHKQFPDEYTTEVLAQKFEVSPEAIRRILRSKWTPDPDEEAERQERWFNRGKKVWSQWAELGKKPPRKWRAEGIVRDPVWNKPRGPTHKDKAARAEAQRKLAKAMMG